jgi:hypothetical protein
LPFSLEQELSRVCLIILPNYFIFVNP